jgi:PAS domain S-box-containing protein
MLSPERKLNLVLDFLKIVSTDLEYSTLMKLVLNQTISSFDAEVGCILISSPRGLIQEASSGLEKKDLEKTINKVTGATLLEDVMQSRMAWIFDRARMANEYRSDPSAGHILGLLSIPILFQGKGMGYLILANKISVTGDSDFTADDIDIISLFVYQIGGLIETSRLNSSLMKLNNYTESLLNGLTAGLISIERTGIVKYVNKNFEDMSGYTGTELANQNMNFLLKREKQGYADFLIMVTGRSKVMNYETEMTAKDGSKFLIDLSSSAIQNVQTSKVEIILMMSDITEKRNMENELQRSKHLSALGTFAAEITHELKNPLGAIKSYVDMLPGRVKDEKFVSLAATVIGEEIEKLFGIIKLLLSFARAKSENMKTIDANESVGKVLLLIDEQAKKQNTKIESKLGSAPLIYGDAQQIQQVLLNIIQNALQAMEQGGSVTITTDHIKKKFPDLEATSFFFISIKDTGPGMPQSVLDKIFTPFFTTKASGTGLGLSICYKIIEDHKAKIEIKSEEGKGTEFIIYFIPTPLP